MPFPFLNFNSITMLRNFFLGISLFFVLIPTNAQTDSVKLSVPLSDTTTPSLSITGAVDAYYRFDFNNPTSKPYNSFTSFTKTQNSFALGMANVKFELQTKRTDVVADLGFGQREEEFAYNDHGISQAIKQLYLSYSPNSWLKFTVGSWATHLNYEPADAFANRNYSMSYYFTFGPFSHTGIKVDFVTSKKTSFMIGLANATDYRIAPTEQINKKFLLAQFTYTPNENLQLLLNYVGGQAPDSSKSNITNVIITDKITSKFNIVYNGILANVKLWDVAKDVATKSWWGSALYFNYDPKNWFGLTIRSEYFNDDKQLNLYATLPAGGNVFSNTLSANFKVEGLTFIPEFRFDHASAPLFVKHSGMLTKSDASFIMAVVYKF
jgi:putative OmpL-like beta-barrel porin-2